MSTKRRYLLLAGAAAAAVALGGGSYFVWKKTKWGPKTAHAFDFFKNTWVGKQSSSAVVGANAAGCAALCDSNPACTAYVTRSDDSSFCSTFEGNPLTAAKYDETSPFSLFIKREPTDPAIAWSDWDACTAECGGGKRARTCTVSGKCPGPDILECNTQPCDVPIKQPAQTKPYPDEPVKEADYKSFLDVNWEKDTTAILMVEKADHSFHCYLYNKPVTALQPAPELAGKMAALYVRAPAGSTGTWSAFPPCKCGISSVQRMCPTSGAPCGGPSVLKCPDVPCAYDSFRHTSVSGI